MTATPFQYLTGRTGFVLALVGSLALHSFVLIGLVFIKTPVSYSEFRSSLNYTLLSTNDFATETNSIDNVIESSIAVTVVSETGDETQSDAQSNPPNASQSLVFEDLILIRESRPLATQSDSFETSPHSSAEDSDTSTQSTSVNQEFAAPLKDQAPQALRTSVIGDVASITAFIEQQSGSGRTQAYSPATHDHSPEAKRYIEAFTQKVRRIGQVNYPEEAASRKLNGDLSLAITIDASGKIASAKVIRSSKHEVLDAAALRIIELGAPYAPLPQSVRNSKRQLEFVQNWSFRDRLLLTD